VADFHGAGGPDAPLRILFAGSPGIAVPALEALAGLDAVTAALAASPVDMPPEPRFELAGVLTNPDSPRGRHGTPEPTEAGAAAARISEERRRLGRPPLPVIKAPKLDAAVRQEIAALAPDILVSFAYGRIFGPKFLALFPRGGINIHPSLLPKYRGPTPISAAILRRDRETGISIQRLAAEMDSGDILLQEAVPLHGRETAGDLGKTMAEKAVPLLVAALRGLARGTIRGRPQNHGEATYCSLLSKEDGRIDWTQSAADIDARVRAFSPWPLCWTRQGDQTLYILETLPPAPQGRPARREHAGPPGPVVSKEPDVSKEPSVSKEPGRVLGVDKQRGILVQTGDGVLIVTRLQYQAKKALEWRAFLNGAREFTGSRLT
jgi:methionyl-tRNA formyltransferase